MAKSNLTIDDVERMLNDMKTLYVTNENAFFMCSMGLIIFCELFTNPIGTSFHSSYAMWIRISRSWRRSIEEYDEYSH